MVKSHDWSLKRRRRPLYNFAHRMFWGSRVLFVTPFAAKGQKRTRQRIQTTCVTLTLNHAAGNGAHRRSMSYICAKYEANPSNRRWLCHHDGADVLAPIMQQAIRSHHAKSTVTIVSSLSWSIYIVLQQISSFQCFFFIDAFVFSLQ